MGLITSKTSGWWCWRSASPFVPFSTYSNQSINCKSGRHHHRPNYGTWQYLRKQKRERAQQRNVPARTMHVYERNRSQMWTRSAGSPVHMVPAKHNRKMEGWQIRARPHLERSPNPGSTYNCSADAVRMESSQRQLIQHWRPWEKETKLQNECVLVGLHYGDKNDLMKQKTTSGTWWGLPNCPWNTNGILHFCKI